MEKRIIWWILCGILTHSNTFCQEILADTAFVNLVLTRNPQVKQLLLFSKSAESEILDAKGGFDPKIYGNYDQKLFNGSQYYTEAEYGIKIPTWYGIEFKAAYLQSSGIFLNPEQKLPKSGQPVLGINFPIIQGLLFDERRAQVLKSRTLPNFYNLERQIFLNDFLLEALTSYWKWQFAHSQFKLTTDAFETSKSRFENIRKLYVLGDRMAMDTLEAFIQVQDRLLLLNDANQELNSAILKVNSFIFNSLTLLKPIVNSNYAPTEKPIKTLETKNETELIFNSNHLILKQYEIKLDQLAIDLKLKKEKLKPKLNLSYNFLGDGFSFPSLLSDNYKWGINFSSPVLFRSERAGTQLSKIKIETTQLQLSQKKIELENKWRNSQSEFANIAQQLELIRSTTENYKKLLQLEIKRFELGESSFFLINSRETKFLESQIKLAKFQSELQIAQIRILNAQSTLPFSF